ncbi:serine hydrolase domain-containing protein [Kineosporia babensis]|uniref:Beta-lactamase family protein n=1 Tax=Kineosporia babensis TaxID=499548 RepID=A0A9X1SYU2_9ACTN|nr:serine hydrolase domain-containing protein [Kineosporia babensis]MCD5311323.1 beta-lactamase family protein [Kineosporia babensis]
MAVWSGAKSIRRGWILAALLLAACTVSPEKASAPEPTNDVMQEVAREVLEANVPGFMARIGNGQEVQYTALGVADRQTERAMKATDQFQIGSATKTFMATLTLQLVDEGKVDLDAPIEEYLPGLLPDGADITVRMLLNHTSGLYNYTEDDGYWRAWEADPQRLWTEKELVQIAVDKGLNFVPGENYSYSNTGYTVIGMMLQERTGQTLSELLEQRITGPLGLKRTYLPRPVATDTGPGYAHGYVLRFIGTKPNYTDTVSWPVDGLSGAAGAMVADQDDVATFFSALLTGKLFSAEQLAQMKTVVDRPADFPVGSGYGLGLLKSTNSCGTVWGHGGQTEGHRSLSAVTEDGVGTVVMDLTAVPMSENPNDGTRRWDEVVAAAEETAVCRMLGKPVPAEVMARLRGVPNSG